MATTLKNLVISKVDFVDQGANPDADIKLYKRKDGNEQAAADGSKKSRGVLKKLFNLICKAAGMDPDELDSEMEEITKGDSVSFSDKINEVKNMKIADEMWDVCYALQSSLFSILNDEDLDSTGVKKAMQESLDEFYSVVQESIEKWSSGKATGIEKKDEELTDDEVRMMKSAVARLNESIEKAAAPASNEEQQTEYQKQKGEETEMKIDKSKLTESERAFLDSIEKRYGTDEGDPGNVAPNAVEQVTAATSNPTVTKSGTQAEAAPSAEDTDIYKGMNPMVAAELAELKKFREAAEEKELTDVAKRYELIGKKPEELVPVLKSLKAAGGTAYNDMIAVLDQTLEMVEKSGAFSEIGKSGHGSSATGAVEAKVDTIAKGYMENDSSMDYTAALAKAWEDHPELIGEYEEEAGF